MNESFQSEGLPEEIILNNEFVVDSEGKKYLYEVNGVKFGGDYLDEVPAEISLDELPPAPEEKNFVL